MGSGRGSNASSRKNLRPFKPGQSGNPEGARRHNPELKALKQLTGTDIEAVVTLLLRSNLAEIKKAQKDQNSGVLTAWLASIAVKGIKRGDARSLDILLTRLLGRPREVPIEINKAFTFTDFVRIANSKKAI